MLYIILHTILQGHKFIMYEYSLIQFRTRRKIIFNIYIRLSSITNFDFAFRSYQICFELLILVFIHVYVIGQYNKYQYRIISNENENIATTERITL